MCDLLHTPQTVEDGKDAPQAKLWASYRLVVVIISMMTLTFSFGSQTSMSSALVCMIDDDADSDLKANQTDVGFLINVSGSQPPEHQKHSWKFAWSYRGREWALTYFFLGNFMMQIITGSILVPRFGNKKTLICSLLLCMTFQLLTVPAAFMGLTWLYLDRFLAGLANGPLYSSVFGVVANWAPLGERNFLFGLTGTGSEIGNVLTFTVSAVSCGTGVQGGWPFVFYFMGFNALIAVLLNVVFVSNKPTSNRYLGHKEKTYLESALSECKQTHNEKIKIPYRKILTSLPVWAVVVGKLGSEYAFYLTITQTPIFLADVLKLSQAEVSLLSGFPFLAVIPTVCVVGIATDKLVVKGIFTVTTIRKVNDFFGKILPSVLLIVLGFLPEGSVTSALVVNVLSSATYGFTYFSYVVNPADLSPAHTTFMFSLSSTFGQWESFVVPIIVGAMTEEKTRQGWQNTFYLGAAIQVAAFIFYAIFASGELQPWARNEVNNDDVIVTKPKPEVKPNDQVIKDINDSKVNQSKFNGDVVMNHHVLDENSRLINGSKSKFKIIVSLFPSSLRGYRTMH